MTPRIVLEHGRQVWFIEDDGALHWWHLGEREVQELLYAQDDPGGLP